MEEEEEKSDLINLKVEEGGRQKTAFRYCELQLLLQEEQDVSISLVLWLPCGTRELLIGLAARPSSRDKALCRSSCA